MSKRKTITSSDESDISISRFHNSVSHFRSEEEKALKIKVIATKDFPNIVANESSSEENVLELPEFDEGKIATFQPTKYPHLNSLQTKFLNKLKLVVVNNDSASEESNFERYIDDLMIFLYEHIGFDDGKNITMRPCNLRFHIGEEDFAAYTDREGRKGTGVIWVMCEDKHIMSRTYKKGEIQVVCCMMAAYQYNYSILNNNIYPPRMIGIRVVADRFYFYSIKKPDEYIEDLFDGLPKRDLEVMRYPENEGLSLSNPYERKEILKYLNTVKNYALTLEIEE